MGTETHGAVGDPYVPLYLLALLAGLIPLVFVLMRTPGWNGPPYWPWRYATDAVWPFLGLAAVACGVACAVDWWAATGNRLRAAVAALAVLHAALAVAFAALSTGGLETLRERVMHPDITSYHAEAARQDDIVELLDFYPRKLPGMIGHAQTHPPGPVLYYVFWDRLTGERGGALWGALFLAVVAGLAVAGVAAAASLAGGAQAAVAAAVWMALMPGSLAMLGSFDAAYPAVTAGVFAAWAFALWRNSSLAAAGAALLLSLGLFFAHQFLTLGVGLAVLTAWAVWSATDRVKAAREAGLLVGVAVVVTVGCFGLLALIFGYDHIGALQMSMFIQRRLEQVWDRPQSLTALWDVYDFFLASGWLSAGVLGAFFWRWRGRAQGERGKVLTGWVLAAVVSLIVIDLSGLLRAETARVWLFLQPLMVVLLGVELARWPAAWRYAAYGGLCVAAAVIRARLIFL